VLLGGAPAEADAASATLPLALASGCDPTCIAFCMTSLSVGLNTDKEAMRYLT
jgi:hypothetical protein